MDIDKMVASKLHYYKNLQKQINAHQTKASSASLREHFKERQKVTNYQNEYDRIRSVVDHSVIKKGPNTVDLLQKRIKDLEKLGAKAIDSLG